jgi:glycosyltransferase involved in cell wall biosynthesis
MKEGYIPQDKRKKILLIADDIRVHSGVAQIAREFVVHSCHRYSFACLAGAVNHPDKGKRIDMSEAMSEMSGNNIKDGYVMVYPIDGYGNMEVIREVIRLENPDAIFIITDPRYYEWLFQSENEFRTKMPIVYLNIWDDVPAPVYNREFYESCDALFGISKQTVNINKMVLGDKAKDKLIKYVPHGLNNDWFKPLNSDNEKLKVFKNKLFNGKKYDFTLLFNSRNIRRKSILDTLLAWKVFTENLPVSKAKKTALILKTDPVDGNGTDLPRAIEYFFHDNPSDVLVLGSKLSTEDMSYLYNSVDGTILLSSNEGWGLSLTESLLCGVPFIANVTGGMQDQMRFEDADGNWYTPSPEVPSNHRGTYKKHGEWAFPVYPCSISLQGSVPTPYIFDDRCSWEDAALQIENLYNLTSKERKRRGMEGMKWATSNEAGFTSIKMTDKLIESLDYLFNNWKPRSKYLFFSDTDLKKEVLPHKLIY